MSGLDSLRPTETSVQMDDFAIRQAFLARPARLRPSLERLMTSAYPGALAAVCLTPFVITAVLHELGASLAHLSLAGPLAEGAGFLGIPIALAAGGLTPKRAFLVPFALSRLCLLLIVALLLAGINEPTLILASYGVAVALAGSSQGAMHTWLRAVVPDRIQAPFFGRRTGIGLALGSVGILTIGLACDAGWPVAGVLAIGWVMALLDLNLLRGIASTGPQGTLGLASRAAACLDVLRSKQTWRLVVVSVLAYMGYAFVLPFQLPYYYDLGFASGDVALLSTLMGLGAGFGAWSGGRVCASMGAPRTTGLGSGLVALAAMGHLLLPGSLGGLALPACLLGVSFGWLVVSFNQIMYREVGAGGIMTYATLTSLLLGARMILMVASSRIGCGLESDGIDYAAPVFITATLLAALGAVALTCTPIARPSRIRQNC